MQRQELSPGRANIWATRGAGAVTLSTHLDTVPPFIPPKRDGTRLTGRGACDAKGIAASMMAAAQTLAEQGENGVDLLFVVGEEKSSDGARAANELAATSRFLINGEPTEGRLAFGAKGSMAVTVRTHGRAAHSAYPELGDSAITPCSHSFPPSRSSTSHPIPYSAPRRSTWAPSTRGEKRISSRTKRLRSSWCAWSAISRCVRDILARWALGRADLEFAPHIPAQHFQTMPGFASGPVSYTSDIPLLGRWGTPLLFGPGSITVAHTPHEFIEIADLHDAVDGYMRLVRTLLAS